MVPEPDPESNLLLCALPEPVRQQWRPQLEYVHMPLGFVLRESHAVMRHVYFPTTAIVSMQCLMENGASTEIALIGREGVIGTSAFLGGGPMPSRSVALIAGNGFRLKAQAIKDEFNLKGSITHLLLRYTQALITQLTQTAAGNRHHALDQQLCRLLLLCLDRLQSNEVDMTHELIASMLGVRREGVTDAAVNLQRAGLIHYHRGHITVLDRLGLEKRTCECYKVVKSEYDRLLPSVPTIRPAVPSVMKLPETPALFARPVLPGRLPAVA